MRHTPTALGLIDPDGEAYEWQRAQVQRLARSLGYELIWASETSLLPVVDQVRASDVDIVISPTQDRLDALTLNAVMSLMSVECVSPRLTFARWLDVNTGAVE